MDRSREDGHAGYLDTPAGGDLMNWERDGTRFFEDPTYDKVGPREYLHAVDPEEVLELLYDDIPTGLVLDVHEEGPAAAWTPGVVVHMEAHAWADVLPVGWVYVPDWD